MSRVKVAFLYSEVAGYFLACAAELCKRAEVLIFRWPISKEAPFDFSKYGDLTILDRSRFTQKELETELREFNPNLIICSGWMDKGYIRTARFFKKRIPVLLALDNHWVASIKQRIAISSSAFHIKRIFTHAWVPGKPQEEFAAKLGFKGDKILRDFYCADGNLFEGYYKATFDSKRRKFPRRFLYVGRYVERKGIFEMWEAFLQLQKESPNDWELWCLGTGEEWQSRVEGDKIKHVGFVQPSEIQKYVKETGIYILPSKFEPWGVTVQEFAICGFPLLLSSEIGAKWTYLKEGENGFEFQAGKSLAIKDAMKKIIGMTDSELIEMGDRSHEIGRSFTPDKWVKNLLSIQNH